MCRTILLISCSILFLIPRCVATDDQKENDVEEQEKEKTELDPSEIKSEVGTWVPAFIYRNEHEYEKYKERTIHDKQPFIDLLKTTRNLKDIIVFEEQCVNDKEYDALKNLADSIEKRIIVVDWKELKNPLQMLMENTQGHDFSDLKSQTLENVKLVNFPYMTLKRNELQISSNESEHNMKENIKYFLDSYQKDYAGGSTKSNAFKYLVNHYTWIRFHTHDWPSAQSIHDRKILQKKNFEIVFNNFANDRSNAFLIYTSEQTYCHRAQLKDPREIWDMKDKRWGSTTVWCRTNHILLQIADLTVLFPDQVLQKPKGARYCETTVYREHMVVIMRLNSYSRDVDLYFDIKLPSSKQNIDQKYRTYTVGKICSVRLAWPRRWSIKQVIFLIQDGKKEYTDRFQPTSLAPIWTKEVIKPLLDKA